MEFNKIFKKLIYEDNQTDLLKQIIGDDSDGKGTDIPTPKEPEETESDKEEDESDKEEDENKEDENKKEADIKQKKNKERHNRLKSYVDKVISDIHFQVDKEPKIILSDFKSYGVKESVLRFIEIKFIPQIENSDDKLFLTINIDEFSIMVADKLGDNFLQVNN